MSNPEQNHNQMNELQEAIKLRQIVNSNIGYSDKPQTLEDFDKAQERLTTEQVNMETTTVSVIEQTMREYNWLKKLTVLEFKAGRLSDKEYEQAFALAQEVQNHLYNICELRMQHAVKDPEKWREIIEVNVGADHYRTEKEKLEVLRHIIEKRYSNDEKLVEFDGWLRIKAMRKQLEQDFKN